MLKQLQQQGFTIVQCTDQHKVNQINQFSFPYVKLSKIIQISKVVDFYNGSRGAIGGYVYYTEGGKGVMYDVSRVNGTEIEHLNTHKDDYEFYAHPVAIGERLIYHFLNGSL